MRRRTRKSYWLLLSNRDSQESYRHFLILLRFYWLPVIK